MIYWPIGYFIIFQPRLEVFFLHLGYRDGCKEVATPQGAIRPHFEVSKIILKKQERFSLFNFKGVLYVCDGQKSL